MDLVITPGVSVKIENFETKFAEIHPVTNLRATKNKPEDTFTYVELYNGNTRIIGFCNNPSNTESTNTIGELTINSGEGGDLSMNDVWTEMQSIFA